MRSELLSTSRLLGTILAVILLYVGQGVVARPAHAQSSGVTCSVVNGIYTCTDGSVGSSGNVCVTDTATGLQSCTYVGGSSGQTQTAQLGDGLGSVQSLPNAAPSTGWLSRLTWWIAYALRQVVVALMTFLRDLVTFVFVVIFGIISSAIAQIGVPSWLSQYSLGSILGQTGQVLGFFLVQLRVPEGFALIGSGYAFRLLRKFLTLFQW